MSQPAGQTANADQYDLGSTATDQTAPPTTPPAGDVAAQPGAPLRRSDGTFLPKHSHPDRLVRQARRPRASQRRGHRGPPPRPTSART
jgi:hypothetical protein